MWMSNSRIRLTCLRPSDDVMIHSKNYNFSVFTIQSVACEKFHNCTIVAFQINQDVIWISWQRGCKQVSRIRYLKILSWKLLTTNLKLIHLILSSWCQESLNHEQRDTVIFLALFGFEKKQTLFQASPILPFHIPFSLLLTFIWILQFCYCDFSVNCMTSC